MSADNGNGQRPSLRRTDRDEAPLYLARYFERQARSGSGYGESGEAGDDGTPLYLRRFRQRRSAETITEQLPPLWQRSSHGMQRTLSEDNRNKEISAPPEARLKVANDIYLLRHGETQGYSTESGLTPLGSWQAHSWGHTLAKRVKSGERVVLASATTNRARQTAEHVHRGLLDGLAMFEKDVQVTAPAAADEFRNFAVATSDGLRDVTSAFRQYYAQLEEFERTAVGDRPLWLVELDRFWRTQQGGGDPIQHWLTIPMLHFEPPAMCVRRFWAGVQKMAAADPGARLVVATHSGPIRAFAVAAFGYDPGEPYNTEHVRVKLLEGGTEALVTYRNRVQQIHVPDLATLPAWQLDEGASAPVDDPAGVS
jgi:broad specificity phosphatase PhoE